MNNLTEEQFALLKAWIEAMIVNHRSEHISDWIRQNDLEKDLRQSFGLPEYPPSPEETK